MRKDEVRAGGAPRRRKRRRRKLSKVAYFLILLLIALCAAAVCIALFFNVDKITVTGKTTYKESQIIKASGIKTGTNILKINMKDCEKEICEELPYIQSAKVSYGLPTTIKIEVTAAKAEYLVENGKKFIAVDSNLKVLDDNVDAAKVKGAVKITGAKIKSAEPGSVMVFSEASQSEDLKNVIAGIKDVKTTKISKIDITDSFQVSALYDNRITVLFGSTHNIPEKLTSASQIIEKELHKTDKGKLDVSTLNRRYTYTPS